VIAITAAMSTVLEQLTSVPTVMLETATPGISAKECILLGIANSEIHLRATHRVAPASRVTVRFEHVSVPGEVLYCKPKEREWLACIGFTSSHRDQTDPRFPVDFPARVITLDKSGSVRSDGRVTDISLSGLVVLARQHSHLSVTVQNNGLTVAHSVSPGSMICVETGVILAIGSVRYCHHHPGKELYRIGMEITDILHGAEQLPRFGVRLDSVRRKLAELILGRQLQARFDAL
jgi:hypothetical protein